MKRLIKENSKILILSLIFLVLFFITLAVFSVCSSQQMDKDINAYFSKVSNQFLTKISLMFSLFFEPIGIILISLIISAALYFNAMKKDSFFLLNNSLLGGILGFLFKEIIQRQRPENLFETGFGFPSGHAIMAVVFFCSLNYLSLKNVKSNYQYLVSFFSVFFIFAILFSRIYLGVHWFSDILGGIFLGGFVFLFNLYFFEGIK